MKKNETINCPRFQFINVKNLKFFKGFQIRTLIVFSSLIILTGCNKNDEILTSNQDLLNDARKSSRFSIKENPFEYTSDFLAKIGKGVLLKTNDKKFKEIIYDEIGKKFDGDYNVLIKKVQEIGKKYNYNLSDEIIKANRIDKSSSEFVLSAFKNIDGNEYFPQIFIPNFEVLSKKSLLGKSPITIVIFNGDEEIMKNNKVSGIKLGANNSFEVINNITENYSEENEVWVISLNERTYGTINGIVNKTSNAKNQSIKTDKNARVNETYYYDWYFTKVTVKVNYEGWLAGQSEVYMKGYLDRVKPDMTTEIRRMYCCVDFYNIGNFTENVPKTDFNGGPFVSSYQATNNFNYDVDSRFPGFFSDKHFYFVIYEDDNWPQPLRYESLPNLIAPGDITFEYRSSNSRYWSGTHDSNLTPLFASVPEISGITPTIDINFKLVLKSI